MGEMEEEFGGEEIGEEGEKKKVWAKSEKGKGSVSLQWLGRAAQRSLALSRRQSVTFSHTHTRSVLSLSL